MSESCYSKSVKEWMGKGQLHFPACFCSNA
nr:MAG TPA: hypothetical protein [Caudoviricetes sp.]